MKQLQSAYFHIAGVTPHLFTRRASLEHIFAHCKMSLIHYRFQLSLLCETGCMLTAHIVFLMLSCPVSLARVSHSAAWLLTATAVSPQWQCLIFDRQHCNPPWRKCSEPPCVLPFRCWPERTGSDPPTVRYFLANFACAALMCMFELQSFKPTTHVTISTACVYRSINRHSINAAS